MILFESWSELWRVAASSVLIYLFVLAWVRVIGKRSASKMNNFDWIVTVAMGAIVSTAILSEEVVVLEACLAVSMLFALQYVITKASYHFPLAARMVRAEPSLLLHNGVFREEALARERISRADVEKAMREHGFSDASQVGAVVMETDASLSVIGRTSGPTGLVDALASGDAKP